MRDYVHEIRAGRLASKHLLRELTGVQAQERYATGDEYTGNRQFVSFLQYRDLVLISTANGPIWTKMAKADVCDRVSRG